MSDMEQRTIDRLMQVINRQNETIDKQFSTILHLEEQIREYQNMNKTKMIKGGL
mgnify:CR=1 FL=1